MFIRIYINWKSLLHPLQSGGIFHPIKNYYLRKTRGVGCCDVYSLFDYLSKIILPALKVFKENKPGYPMCVIGRKKEEMTMEKWDEILSDMIYAFEAIELDNKCEKINYKRQQKGFELFGKYYHDLWF